MTRTPLVVMTLLAAIGVGAGFIRTAIASDHLDSAALATDPTVDIADVYAFMRPKTSGSSTFEKSTHLVAAMTVYPNAPRQAEFEEYVDYTLSFVGIDDPATGLLGALDASLVCHFRPKTGDSPDGLPLQPFTCSANGSFFVGVTNEVSGASTDRLRVFAGLRSDPAFGAVPGVLAAVDAGNLPGADAGPNTFAGQNVLSIVAELDVGKVLFGDAGASVIGVSGLTERL